MNNFNWFSFLADATSIFGFIVTVLVWIGIRNLKSYYVAKATIPQLMKDLSDFRDQVEVLFNGKYDKPKEVKIKEISSAVNVIVKNLTPKIKEVDKSQYSIQVEPHARNFNEAFGIFTFNPNKDNARVMNRRLAEFIQSANLLITDNEWRRIQ